MNICDKLTSFIEKCLKKRPSFQNNELDMSRHNDLDSDCVCLKKSDNSSCCNEECLDSRSRSSSVTSSKNEKIIEELSPSLDLSNISKKIDEIIDLMKECEIKETCKCNDGEPLLSS